VVVTEQRAGGHVLIIDDDPDHRESLAVLLEAEGYAVAAVAGGREAMAHLRSGALPSVILLDLMMPVMNGWEFCAAQQRDPALASIPVIVLSALDGLDRLAGSLNAAGYLRKPVKVSALLATAARFRP